MEPSQDDNPRLFCLALNTYAAAVTRASTERSIASVQTPDAAVLAGPSTLLVQQAESLAARNRTTGAGQKPQAVGRRRKRKGSCGHRRAHVPVTGGCDVDAPGRRA